MEKDRSGKKNPFWGKKHTEEQRKKWSADRKGKKVSAETREKMSQRMKGNKCAVGKKNRTTEETRKKMSLVRIGKVNSEETRAKISQSNKGKLGFWTGKKRPNMSGENNPKWIIDRTKLCRLSKQGERRTSAYFNWRKQVWNRDNWVCKINNSDCSGRLEAHHILGFTDHPELRYDINNGITLCHAHHPRKRAEEKQLIPVFKELVSVSKM